MLENERRVLSYFDNCSIESGGETFIPVSEIDDLIKLCEINQAVVYSVELFTIRDGKVMPYSELMSIDASQLFDNNAVWEVNMKKCNDFILDCFKKFRGNKTHLYLCAIFEFSKE